MITLNFTQEHLNLLAVAIQELPHKHAVPLIAEINKQIEAQKKAAQTSSVDFASEPSQ
jgi:hypothetical protein